MQRQILLTCWKLSKLEDGTPLRTVETIRCISVSPKRNGNLQITLPNFVRVQMPLQDVISVSAI